MADFCWDCVQRLGVSPELNDLRVEPPETRLDVCEGCGFGVFDGDGKRVGVVQPRCSCPAGRGTNPGCQVCP